MRREFFRLPARHIDSIDTGVIETSVDSRGDDVFAVASPGVELPQVVFGLLVCEFLYLAGVPVEKRDVRNRRGLRLVSEGKHFLVGRKLRSRFRDVRRIRQVDWRATFAGDREQVEVFTAAEVLVVDDPLAVGG